jgi:hypothetical protein
MHQKFYKSLHEINPNLARLRPNLGHRPAGVDAADASLNLLERRLPTRVPRRAGQFQSCISWGIHGLSKVLLGPAMPDHYMPCGRPPHKRLYSHFRGGRRQEGRFMGVLLPLWIPHAVRTW